MDIILFPKFDPFALARLVYKNEEKPAAAEAAEKKPKKGKKRETPEAKAARLEREKKEADARKAATKRPADQEAAGAENFLQMAFGKSSDTGRLNDLDAKYKDQPEKVKDVVLKAIDQFQPVITEIMKGALAVIDSVKKEKGTVDVAQTVQQAIAKMSAGLKEKATSFESKLSAEDKEMLELAIGRIWGKGIQDFIANTKKFEDQFGKNLTVEQLKEKITKNEIIPDQYGLALIYGFGNILNQAEAKLAEVKTETHSKKEIDDAYRRNKKAFDDFAQGKIDQQQFSDAITDKDDRKALQWVLDSAVTPTEIDDLTKDLTGRKPPVEIPQTQEALNALYASGAINPRDYKIGTAILEANKPVETPAGTVTQAAWGDTLVQLFEKIAKLFERMLKDLEKAFTPKDAATKPFEKSPFGGDKKFDIKTASKGVDLVADTAGAKAVSVVAGTVETVDSINKTVTIKTSGGTTFIYGGIDPTISKGATVSEGQELGKIVTNTLNLQILDAQNVQKDPRSLLGKFTKTSATPAVPPAAEAKEGEGVKAFTFETPPLVLGADEKLTIKKDFADSGNKNVEISSTEGAAVQTVADKGKVIKAEGGEVKIKYPDGSIVTFAGLKTPLEVTADPNQELEKGKKLGVVGESAALVIAVEKPEGTIINPETNLLQPYLKHEGGKSPAAEDKKPDEGKPVEGQPQETKAEKPKTQPLLVRGLQGLREPTNDEVANVFERLQLGQVGRAPTPDEIAMIKAGYYETKDGPMPVPDAIRNELLNIVPASRSIAVNEGGVVRPPTDNEISALATALGMFEGESRPLEAEEKTTILAGFYQTKEGPIEPIPAEIIKKTIPNALYNG